VRFLPRNIREGACQKFLGTCLLLETAPSRVYISKSPRRATSDHQSSCDRHSSFVSTCQRSKEPATDRWFGNLWSQAKHAKVQYQSSNLTGKLLLTSSPAPKQRSRYVSPVWSICRREPISRESQPPRLAVRNGVQQMTTPPRKVGHSSSHYT